MNNFHIFLSSPSDCNAERTAVHQIASKLNADPLVKKFARIEVIAWDSDNGIPFDAFESPQSSVDARMLRPEQCHLVIGIFRQRFGTPLPINSGCKANGQPYLSGSEYELHKARDARRRGASLAEIFVYRWQAPLEITPPDASQFERLETFFKSPPFRDGDESIGAVMGFVDTQDFATQAESHIKQVLSQYLPGAKKPLPAWLLEQAALVTKNAGPRYTQAAHVETDIAKAFDWLLARQPAIAALDQALAEVYENLSDISELQAHKKAMEAVAESLRADFTWQTLPDFSALISMLEELQKSAWQAYSRLRQEKEAAKHDGRHENDDYSARQAGNKARSAEELLREFSPLATNRVMLLHGPAGQGKTHTLVHELNRVLQKGGIAVAVLGQTLSNSGGLWKAVCQRLAWDSDTGHLLDELENEAARKEQRALLVFDALNETPSNQRWRTELLGIIAMVLQRPHLSLIISVREDYLKHVLPSIPEHQGPPWIKLRHPGFAGIAPAALTQYFAFYGLKAPVAPILGEFDNPLYVQLLVKSLQKRPFQHWQPSWQDVWQAWVAKLEEDAIVLLDPSRLHPIARTMRKLAQAMLDTSRMEVMRKQADDIAKEICGNDGVIGYLCSAGALITRLVGDEDDDEIVEFGFERLSDTFVVEQLLQKLFDGLATPAQKRSALETALAPNGMLRPLISHDAPMHFLAMRRPGLLKALCLAVPPLVGTELPILVKSAENTDSKWALDSAFADSLCWRAEFALPAHELHQLLQEFNDYPNKAAAWDAIIRFCLIPNHPLGMDWVHATMLAKESPGARDAELAIHLPELWERLHSNLRQLLKWACDADLHGVQASLALPAARLLAWLCSTSQRGLRKAAIQGLTRLLVACPQIVPNFLPDFLIVNDAYVLEAVLVAVWGMVLAGSNKDAAAHAARLVYKVQFANKQAACCHITVRHYARQIMETAAKNGLLEDLDMTLVRPPYYSDLPLDQVPNQLELDAMESTTDLGSIIYSATSGDFFETIIGGNTSDPPFSGIPLKGDSAKPRSSKVPSMKRAGRASVFDLHLAGRYVAWNAIALGWNKESFSEFDDELAYTRYSDEDRTERIGEKYQWIGWYSVLGFLADHYKMQSDWNHKRRTYSGPDQLELALFDPSRWLQMPAQKSDGDATDNSGQLPFRPAWPEPSFSAMRRWVQSTQDDFAMLDSITCLPELPPAWGNGPWLRIAARHKWQSEFAPGQWGLGRRFSADIWWRAIPVLIRADNLPHLLKKVQEEASQNRLKRKNGVAYTHGGSIALPDWARADEEWDEGFVSPKKNENKPIWLPVQARSMLAECGEHYGVDVHASVLLPMPSLFREWDLQLDLQHSLIRQNGTPVFGLGNGIGTLFAHIPTLLRLLQESSYALVWVLRGERHAFNNVQVFSAKEFVSAEYFALGYLETNGQAKMMPWYNKTILDKQS